MVAIIFSNILTIELLARLEIQFPTLFVPTQDNKYLDHGFITFIRKRNTLLTFV